MNTRLVPRICSAAGILVLPALLVSWLSAPAGGGPVPARNRYIGAKACRSCHRSESKGAQFQTWQKAKHSGAYKMLGTPEAKKVGAALGVDEPQKSPKCLQCHVTAYGEAKKKFKRSFKIEDGVQCETCHGPGERHAKKRFAEASKGGKTEDHVTVPADEIIAQPKVEKCLGCHNEKSPSFKPFCFKKFREKISHLDPRKKRSAKEIAALKCPCGDDCACEKAECGGYEASDVRCVAKKKDGEGKKKKDK